MGRAASVNDAFEGTAGRVAGAVMARLNRDMERAAVEALGPDTTDAVLSIGFGPGVGLAVLVDRLPEGWAAGVDPSATMVSQARRRNRRAIESGRLVVDEAPAEDLPWPDRSFDGVLAVNSMQLWAPLGQGLREIARVLRPGGALVALTHVWAIEKSGPLLQWVRTTTDVLAGAGFGPVVTRTDRYRSGPGVLMETRLLRPCNRTAP